MRRSEEGSPNPGLPQRLGSTSKQLRLRNDRDSHTQTLGIFAY